MCQAELCNERDHMAWINQKHTLEVLSIVSFLINHINKRHNTTIVDWVILKRNKPQENWLCVYIQFNIQFREVFQRVLKISKVETGLSLLAVQLSPFF